jgi:hypothetical protein
MIGILTLATTAQRRWFAHEICIFIKQNAHEYSEAWWKEYLRMIVSGPLDEFLDMLEDKIPGPLPEMLTVLEPSKRLEAVMKILSKALFKYQPCSVLERIGAYLPPTAEVARHKVTILRDGRYEAHECALVLRELEAYWSVALYVMVCACNPQGDGALLRLPERAEAPWATSKLALTRRFFRLIMRLPDDVVRYICRMLYEGAQRMTSADVRFIEKAAIEG